MAKRSLPDSFSIDNLEFAEKPSSARFRDIEGVRFGRLLVIGYKGLVGNHREWYCRCDCGAIVVVFANTLQNGDTQSCGCLNKELASRRLRTHGKTGTQMHRKWKSMLTRCRNPRCRNYDRYGGRGIKVCERWLTFENFLADMGEPPSSQHSLDRIDNDGDYTPENCRWATLETQANNTRTNKTFTLNGRTQTLSQWCRQLGIHRTTVTARLAAGYSIYEAFGINDNTQGEL